ncbi:MAG: efflux RND transporter periplasmic adaptor subunit [Xanthomonadales bacterium]|nr:efflux RND transporter periplasmic adaptor subunit [Gammaproteobacteria bacterium]MBT8051605.1 efflux RND transporter periplasmic adaptor subunit [Gammaproteobacteria bacterium]MBT8057212.1 efflux RND transporter periplasmic adaptor subunit [Gammaproteobacteria bacterium]NNJ79119.1 efflux RND transporter periplasmic adaptor subunit [Xanthomonadales bacterium]NNL04606.1 efflux RND transporter periplasmic adaptor subunit [Xanthomonadales bacterium]
MRKFLKFVLPLGLIALSIVVVLVMVAIAQGKRPDRKDEGNQAVLVEAIQAEVSSLNFSVTSQGAVRPRTETTLVAEVSGQIVTVSPNFVPGGFFRKGEVLLQIDPSDYDTALLRAQANLASRQAQLSDWKARSEQALKDWQNLGRSGEPSDLVLRKPQLAEAQAAVQAAQAELQQAERNLQRTRIRLPYEGLVRNKLVDVGQFVSPGTPLGVTFAVDRAEIRLPLSSSDLQFLELPSATRLDADKRVPVVLTSQNGGENGRWMGEIVRTEGVVDQASRVVYAVTEVVDPYRVLGQSLQDELKMGTFVRAEIEGRRVEDVVVLPRSVLLPDDTVLVANEDRKLEIRPVTVARAEPRQVYVSEGVESGEWVVTTSLDAPIPGTQLAIRGEKPPATDDDGGAPESEESTP